MRSSVVIAVAPFVLLCAFAPLGCSRRVDVGSPYVDPAATLPQGFLAAIRVNLGTTTITRWLELETGDPAVLHVFVLDSGVAGGGEALVLSGPGAAELESILLERGLLSVTKSEGTFRLGSEPSDDGEPGPPRGGAGGALGGGLVNPLAFLTSERLQRFESAGSIVFAPTIDVLHDLVTLDAAAQRELGATADVAVALNGRSFARMLRRRLQNVMGPFGDMAMNQASRHRGMRRATSALDAVLDLVSGVERLQGTYGDTGANVRIRLRPTSSLADLVGATRAFDGAWPLDDEGGFRFMFACDPAALGAALERIWERDDERSDPLPAWWDGRATATIALERRELSRLALGVAPSAHPDAADLQRVAPLVKGDVLQGATLVDGWFAHHPAQPRFGTLAAAPGVFGLLRDGRGSVENARDILRLARESDHVITVAWFGLQTP